MNEEDDVDDGLEDIVEKQVIPGPIPVGVSAIEHWVMRGDLVLLDLRLPKDPTEEFDDLREEYPDEDPHDPDDEADDQEISLSVCLLKGNLTLRSFSFNNSLRVSMRSTAVAVPDDEDNIPNSFRASSNSLDTSRDSSSSVTSVGAEEREDDACC